MSRLGLILCLILLSTNASVAQAQLVLTEFLADPATGLAGDANGDGVRSTSDDEFVELWNSGTDPLDVSGWSLSDDISVRHVFASSTVIAPNTFWVVFGGGAPALSGAHAEVASTGLLSLNNGGDVIILRDALDQVLWEVAYGSEAGQDQSLQRWPLSDAVFMKHGDIIEAQGSLFSPGFLPDGSLLSQEPDAPNAAAVPEGGVTLSYLLGIYLLACFFKKGRCWLLR